MTLIRDSAATASAAATSSTAADDASKQGNIISYNSPTEQARRHYYPLCGKKRSRPTGSSSITSTSASSHNSSSIPGTTIFMPAPAFYSRKSRREHRSSSSSKSSSWRQGLLSWPSLLLVFFLHLTLLFVLVKAQDEATTDETTEHKCPTLDSFLEDACRKDWQLDGYCDQEDPDDPSCQNGDCWDCDPCMAYSYTCSGCKRQANCVWCPGDAICMSQPLGVEYWGGLHPEKITSCPNGYEWLAEECEYAPSTQGADSNVFGDALYTSMRWMYRLIHVEEVWTNEKDDAGEAILGANVRIRVNDNGVDAQHQEMIANFDTAASCKDLYTVADNFKHTHGMAMAALAGANNNGACSVGVSPGAKISSCNVVTEADMPFVLQSQLLEDSTTESVDISINAWYLGNAYSKPIETCWPRNNFNYDGSGPNNNDPAAASTERSATLLLQNHKPYTPAPNRNVPTFMEDNNDIWVHKTTTKSNIRKKTSNNANTKQATDCPFDATVEDSPCDVCDFSKPPDGDCQQSIALYCRLYYNSLLVDASVCDKYYDLFVKCKYHSLQLEVQEMLVRNIVEGRNQKGIVFIVPAGNSGLLGDDANFNGYAASRFTMTVGAVDKDGKTTPYSNPGANVLVSAPGGDAKYVSNTIVGRPGGGCMDGGYGTDFAVPVVAGVAALMLQANPELGWRDVLTILAQTASVVPDPEDEGNRVTTSGGYTHSYKYGFGIVHAARAVNASRGWIPFPREEIITDEAIYVTFDADTKEQLNPGMPIYEAEANNATTSSIDVEFINPFYRVESVLVKIDLRHPSRGDLKITLTSPEGTESLLAPSGRPENTLTRGGDNQRWELLSVRHLWEYPGGTWTLSILDEQPGHWRECVDDDWEFSYEDGDTGLSHTLTCEDFFWVTDCRNETQVNQAVVDVEYDGKSVFDSCCKCGGGVQAKDLESQLLSWELNIYGHISSNPGGTTTLLDVPESTCGFQNDTCPLDLQFNHECDDTLLNEECMGKDCFDCDPCQSFSYDCKKCTTAGCNYCPGDGICMSIALEESFWELYPTKTTTCPNASSWSTTCEDWGDENVFEDPLYDTMQWAYQMIEVEVPWRAGFTGRGVHVRINDDGVDADHKEFELNFDVANSCDVYLPYDKNKDTHGTACASIVGANTNNQCAVGIAPLATLSSCVGPTSLDDAPDLLLSKLESVDISSNSWGPIVCRPKDERQGRRLQDDCLFSKDHPDSPCSACEAYFASGDEMEACEEAVGKYCTDNYEDDVIACSEYLDLFASCEYHILPIEAHNAFVKAMLEGRNGKGITFIFSAGNNYNMGADTNFNGFLNSRYTIGVGAVGKDKKHASYSTTGAAVFVSAPGGDFESVSGNIVAKPGGGCHDITVGTSFSAPVVAGVVALMLEVETNLRWRDIQGILALTSSQVDPEDESWVINAAGYKHSYKYGFGVVNASRALLRADGWKNFDVEKFLNQKSDTLDLPIADDPSKPVTSQISLPEWSEDGDFVTESVVVYLDIDHPSRGDLKIVLTSPGGTEAILAPSKRPENGQLRGDEKGKWKLLSLRTWGEYPTGDWTLTIADESAGNYGDCHDLPFEYAYGRADSLGNETLTCEDLEEVTDCNDSTQLNPAALTELYEGRTILESCCKCGGGQASSEIASILHSWEIFAYGHIVHTYEELLICPPSQCSTKPIHENPNAGIFEADANETETVDELEPLDSSGSNGIYSGGGGTAYAGWRRYNYGEDGILDGGGGNGTSSNSNVQTTPGWALVLAFGCLLTNIVAILG